MGLRKLLFSIKDILLSILFPPICIGCADFLSETASPLCDTCRSSIFRETALLCPVCEARLPMNRRTCNHGQQDRVRFPYLLGAATRYDNATARTVIHLCKYQKVHALTEMCAGMLITYVDSLDPQPSIIDMSPIVVPIPLHPKKERERGFNQSALIAEEFARKKEFPYAELLIKTRYDDPQAKTKTHKERFSRMQGAFAVPDPTSIQNKNIILIDDVSTSGATLSEAAQALKAAGAKQILCLVFAKA